LAAYLFGTTRLASEDAGFGAALAAAHADRSRPKCLCRGGGIEMYVARLAGTEEDFIVKRMPGTGSQHAPACPSYEPPPESSGLGQVLGTAIKEDPASGDVALRLGFSMSKIPGRASAPAPGRPADSVGSEGTRLSLRGLLHYLWDQAELTRWHPGFAGKRSWGTVRRHLQLAAEHKVVRGEALRSRLYIPEPFTVDEREALIARRIAQWRHAIAAPGKPQHLMLLIGEVKEIVPARYGYKAVIKHVPDQGFAIDEPLYRRLGRRFESELVLWSTTDEVHMVMIATFGVSGGGIPAIHELCLMPATRQWIPVEDGFEAQLVERLVSEERVFVKGLRYNLAATSVLACATLTDCEEAAPPLFVPPAGSDAAGLGIAAGGPGAPGWVWHRTAEPMPPLPQAARRSVGSERPSPLGAGASQCRRSH
jgi:hypothetical protein